MTAFHPSPVVNGAHKTSKAAHDRGPLPAAEADLRPGTTTVHRSACQAVMAQGRLCACDHITALIELNRSA